MSEIDINRIIEKERRIVDYLLWADNLLVRIENRKRRKLSEKDEILIKAAWLAIANNSRWYLTNYRKSINGTPVTPMYECIFACRIILETAADFRYYILSDDEIKNIFFKERDDFENDFDEMFEKLKSRSYCRDNEYIPPETTTERIKDCFGEDGVGFYNTLCWSTHFNYTGWLIEKRKDYKLRINGLIYILASINAFLVSMIDAGIIKQSELGNKIINAEECIKNIEGIIVNEQGN